MLVTMTRARCGAAALAFAACALAATAPAQRHDLKRVLPADTILYASLPDLASSLSELGQMPIGRMWAEKETQEFFAGLMQFATAQFDQGLAQAREAHAGGMLPIDPDMILKLRLNGASFAITGVALDASSGAPQPDIGVVVHLDFGASAASWKSLLEFGVTQLGEQSGGRLSPVRTVKDGKTLWTIALPPPAPAAMSVNIAFVGESMLFATRKPEFDAMLAAWDSPAEVSLATAPIFQQTYAHLDRDGVEAEFFVQPQPLIDAMMEGARFAAEADPAVDVAGVERVIQALGLRSIRAVGTTWRYDGARCVTKSFTLVPPEQRKGLLAIEPPLLDSGFLKAISDDASSFSAFTFDLAGIYDGVVAAVRAYDPQLAEQALAQFDEMQKGFGIDLRKDLIASMGNQFVYWSKPMSSVGLPPMFALLKVNDEKAFLKVLRALTDLTGGAVSIVDVKRSGVEMHHLKIDVGSSMPIDIAGSVTPFFTFRGGHLVAALSTQDLLRTATRVQPLDPQAAPKEVPDVRQHPEFAPLLSKIGDRKLYSLSFTDWKATFEGWYQLTSLLGIVPIPPEIPIDISLLPDVSSLTQHLNGSATWSTVEKDGYLSTSISPFGPEIYVGMIGLGIVGAGVTGWVMDAPVGGTRSAPRRGR
jgi:hypothetical protein